MNIDACTRGPQQQEVLRKTSIRLRAQGKTFREIGEYLDVHPLTVGRWDWLKISENKILLRPCGITTNYS